MTRRAGDDHALLDPVERPMGRLFAYLTPLRGRLAAAVGASAANKVLDLAPPLLVGWILDSALGRPESWLTELAGTTDRMELVVFLAVATVVIFAGESACQWAYQYGFQTLAQDAQHALRLDAYAAMQKREMEFFERHRVGKTLAMLGDDVNQLERFLNTGFSDLVQLAVLVLFAGAVLFGYSWDLALVGLVPIPVIIWGSLWYSARLEPRYAGVRRAVGELASRLENNLGGILVIKSFTAEEYELGRVREASEAYQQANREAIKLSAVFIPIIRMAIAVGFAGVIVLGGHRVIQGTLAPGILVTFSMMIQRLLWPFTRLGVTLDEYQRARASAARVFSLLDTECRVKDPPEPVPLGTLRGEVAFEDVRFSYGRGDSILDGLDLRIAPGETLGVAGPTGAGKSTLIKLLLRLYDVESGAVTVDGIDVRAVGQRDLRRHVALVSQDVYVFHGTIRENIAYGHGETALTDGAIERAARLAQLHDFVASLPDGYDTLVGERGIQLSGGQRQRLSIARAILKDAPILILDEATSSVDTETERAIQENLSRLTRGRTALVVAHRLSTIRGADRIVVMDRGRVVEQGTHDGLVAAGGLYADLWRVQSGTRVASQDDRDELATPR